MRNALEAKIIASLKRAGRRGMVFAELKKICEIKPKETDRFRGAVNRMVAEGKIAYTKNRFFHLKSIGVYAAEIVRNSRTFCFAQRASDEARIFIPGKYSRGAILGDLVLVRPQAQLGDSEEGQVFSIYKNGPSAFSGVLMQEDEDYFVQPDNLSKDRIPVRSKSIGDAKPGDKVLAKVVLRGSRHSEHICELTGAYGSAETAAACARAVLDAHGITEEFPQEVLEQARSISEQGIRDSERVHRLDLTDLPIFTIDSADSKDLDDAISIEKAEDCYHVGVHIADVSHYVGYRTPLDQEAFRRGTSIYYANRVIPMLPKELSNGICSLNPQEDRLAFSALMNVSLDGELMDFTFRKTVIRSRVKGVYKEVNALLEGGADEDLKQKYSEVLPSLQLMHELYQRLYQNKVKRGAPQLETSESKIIVDENDVAVDIQPRVQGLSEGMIEEFMLLANEAAATLAKREKLPFVYRIHEHPSPEKLSSLKEILERLGLPSLRVDKKVKPGVLAGILTSSRDSGLFPIINTQVLRSMAKAQYDERPVGHYGLALENYAHFTSPIRRYPDLTIHRILTEYVVLHETPDKIHKRYDKFVAQASKQSTETEITAMQIERECNDRYKAEYIRQHIGEEFDGIITSVLGRGLYIELENTVEGYVKVEDLNGIYEHDGFTELKNHQTGKRYRVGDKVRIQCVAVDVNAGRIDFIIPDDHAEVPQERRRPWK